MPDVPTPDEIINGGKAKQTARVFLLSETGAPIDLTPDQRKSIIVILSGAAFVTIGVVPTVGDAGNPGADFLVAIGGDPDHLRDARADLPDVLLRNLARRGIV